MDNKPLFHFSLPGMDFNEEYEEPDAISSPPRPSSPPPIDTPPNEFLQTICDPNSAILEDTSDDDAEFVIHEKRAPPMKLDEKVWGTLVHMRAAYSRLSIAEFLNGLFTSEDPELKKASGQFYAGSAHLNVMELWWKACGGETDQAMVDWVMDKAAAICAREASHLTDRAYEGPYFEDAKALRLPAASMSVKAVDEFQVKALGSVYDRVTPNLQRILRAVTTPPPGIESKRTREFGRTMMTSMALNLRSQKTNYHQAVMSLIFWDNRMPKRIVQMLNEFGVCSSHPYQIKAVKSLSKSVQELARAAANNAAKIKMLPYDNFNWMSRAWETSATHKSKSHDQVAALLVILPTPDGTDAKTVTSIAQFKEKHSSGRHSIPPRQALAEIIPSRTDEAIFRKNVIVHVQNVLIDTFPMLERQRSSIPKCEEPKPIKPIKTEEYYLPTFDQEQGSTRGNMVVLEHYWGKVLDIPKKTFDDTAFTVLGDRLTVARDRAAQDQRAVDLSPNSFDHLSSFNMVGGLMHYELNFVRQQEAKLSRERHRAVTQCSFSTIL
ncbi:hypothetical protein DFP72DRAFT_977135 [Ephemerocybe angulata]|uniref:DUF6589 domain-containing protein n=1 Tax=Ephemerocybe angulata TaxID=980116 RepID=A0A8H6HCJ3_9AGAR|nr:hypothetical protein DFP72DRAFT_977135 [Tulosesus angulatus]